MTETTPDPITVLVLPVDDWPYLTEVVGDLASYQDLVGGYIEMVSLTRNPDALLVINEDGKRLDLMRNALAGLLLNATGTRLFPGDYIAGTAVVVGRLHAETGVEDGDLHSVPDTVLATLRHRGIPVLDRRTPGTAEAVHAAWQALTATEQLALRDAMMREVAHGIHGWRE